METVNIALTIDETAIIAAECCMSLSDGRCTQPEGRAALEKIIAKMVEPFGFEVDQFRAISDAINAIKQQRVHIN